MSVETDCRSKNLLEALIPVGKDFVLRGRKSGFVSLKAHGTINGPYPKFIYNLLFLNPGLHMFAQGPIQVSRQGRVSVRLVNRTWRPIKITHGSIVGTFLSKKEAGTGTENFIHPPPLMSIKIPQRKPVNITNRLENPNQEIEFSFKKSPDIVLMSLDEKKPGTCYVTFVKNYAYSKMQFQGFNPSDPPLFTGGVDKYYQNNFSQTVLSEFATNSSKFKDTLGTVLEWPNVIYFVFKNDTEAKKCLKVLFPDSKDAENKMKIHVHIMPNCNDMWNKEPLMWNEEIRHFIYNIEKKSPKPLSDFVPFNYIFQNQQI